MVNLFIANTDNPCFDFLASESNIKEVNFWWPGEMGFRATQPGELLAFRLRSPRNKIGGFGVFSKPFVLTDADLLGKFWPCKWRAIV